MAPAVDCHQAHPPGYSSPQPLHQQGPSKYVLEPLLRTLALLGAYRAEAADFMCSQDPAPLLSLLQQPSDRVKLRAVGLLEALAGRAQGRQYVAGSSGALLQQLLEWAGVGTAVVQGPLQVGGCACASMLHHACCLITDTTLQTPSAQLGSIVSTVSGWLEMLLSSTVIPCLHTCVQGAIST
jgi:hypothetical protein